MAKTALDTLAQMFVDLTLTKSRCDSGDIQWFTKSPYWRRPNMRFSRDYRLIGDYEIGDLKHGKTLENILDESNYLLEYLRLYKKTAQQDEIRRVNFLLDHVGHLNARTRILLGEKFSFDQMTEQLYCLKAPAYDHKKFDAILQELNDALPGHGDVQKRIQSFRQQITVPGEKLLDVLTRVTRAFRDFTVKNMDVTGNNEIRVRVRELPHPNEAFITILYSYEYNRIECERNFNLRYPWSVDKVIECIGHEMEPGHFTYFEKRLQAMIDNSWPEMSVLSQFSSSFSLSEGTARYAISMCFDHSVERMIDFERETIFKPSGIDMQLADLMSLWHRYAEIAGYGKLEATRNVWDGIWSEEEASRFLENYAFTDKPTKVSSLAADEGHFVSHDYSRDVVANYFRSVTQDIREQWALYAKMCSGHVSMHDIRDNIFPLN